MEISSFTASRRIGFNLPDYARKAVYKLDDACQGTLGFPTLEEAVSRIEEATLVATVDELGFVAAGLDEDGPIMVDVEQSAAPDVEERVLETIRTYAETALAVCAVAPVLLEIGDDAFDRGDGLLCASENFVLSWRSEDEISIHHLRNGVHVRVDVEEAGALDFVTGRDERDVMDWVCSRVPLLARATSGPDADGLMAGHALERLVPVGKYGVRGARIAYVDPDLVVVADRSGTINAHFRRDGRYALKQIEGDDARELLAIASIRGLDPDDDANPVRVWVRQLADFDVSRCPEPSFEELPELGYNC
jgi:hypothetical protein